MITFKCDNCGGEGRDKEYNYRTKKRHFCSRKCYSEFRRNKMQPEEQNSWKGGITPEESRRKYRLKNKKKTLAMAKARREREMNAPGHHTRKQWEEFKRAHGNRCAESDETCSGTITKDHIVPLILGGSNDIENLQILCGSHNSRKARKVHLGQLSSMA